MHGAGSSAVADSNLDVAVRLSPLIFPMRVLILPQSKLINLFVAVDKGMTVVAIRL